MEDIVKTLPSPRDLNQKSESHGTEMNCRTSKEIEDISKLEKKEQRTNMADISKTSSGKYNSTGKVSACATPTSRPSSKISGRSTRLSVKKSELQGKTIVLRTEKELREYFDAMERPTSQTSATSGCPLTRSCLNRSSVGSTRSGSRHSIESILFADLDNKETKRPKKQHVRRCGSRAERKNEASPSSTDDARKKVHLPQMETAPQQLDVTRRNESNINYSEGRPNTNVSTLASENSQDNIHSERTAKADAGNKNADLAFESQIPADESVQNKKSDDEFTKDQSLTNGKYSLESSPRSDSRRSSNKSYSGQYTPDSCFSDPDYSRSRSKCSEYSRDESAASRSDKVKIPHRNTPDMESQNNSRFSSDTSSRSVSRGSENSKSLCESEVVSGDCSKKISDKEFPVNVQTSEGINSSQSETLSEKGPNPCLEKTKDTDESLSIDKSTRKKPFEKFEENDDKLHMRSVSLVDSVLEEKPINKRSSGISGKHKNNSIVTSSPHIGDKIFWKEKGGSCKGTKTLNIHFHIEKKSDKDQSAATFILPKALNSTKKAHSNSKKIISISNASPKSENARNDVKDLSVMGISFQNKEENSRSPNPTEFHYDDDFEDDSDSEKAQGCKETVESQKSEDDFWNTGVDNTTPSKNQSVAASTKGSAAGDFEKRCSGPDVPERKLPEVKCSEPNVPKKISPELKCSEPDVVEKKSPELNMVGKGFDSLSVKKRKMKPKKLEKQGGKTDENKITREKPCTLDGEPKALSAMVGKKILEDRNEARSQRNNKENSERTPRKSGKDKSKPRQGVEETLVKTKEKQKATEKVRKKTILEGLIAADNLHRNKEKYDTKDMVITGTAKSSPYLNQHDCSASRIPKACATTTVLPSIASTEMNQNLGPYVFSGEQTKQSAVGTVLPRIKATRLVPHQHENRCGDQKRSAHLVNSGRQNKITHPLGEIGYNKKRAEELKLPQRPRLVNERILPKLSSSPAHLNAEATLKNGALEVTVFNPKDQGCEPNSVNIKLTVLHQSREIGPTAHPPTSQQNYVHSAEPDLIKNKTKKAIFDTKKPREIKRLFSQH